MAKPENEGLSIAYRIGWKIRAGMWHLFGPAQTMGPADPHWRLAEERRKKVEAAREARLRRESGDQG